METVSGHVQGSKIREGCRKNQKSPRESTIGHKKRARELFFGDGKA